MTEHISFTSDELQRTTTPPTTTTRVALIGRAGAGKTALTRAIFGAQADAEPTGDTVVRYQGEVTPLVVDDLAGWTQGTQDAERSIDALFTYLDQTLDAAPPLVAVWYALDAVSARVTEYELRLIYRISQIAPVIVVLTRADLVTDEALAAMRSALEQADIPNCRGIVAVAAEPLPALGIAPYGLDTLLALTPTEQAVPPRITTTTTTTTTAHPLTTATSVPATRSIPLTVTRTAPTEHARRSSEGTTRQRAARGSSVQGTQGTQGTQAAQPEDSASAARFIGALAIIAVLVVALFLLGRRRASA